MSRYVKPEEYEKYGMFEENEEELNDHEEVVKEIKEALKDEFIPKSVIEDIKAEIRSIQPKWHENAGKHNCIDEVIKIIDRNISRKEPVGNADKLDKHIGGKENK